MSVPAGRWNRSTTGGVCITGGPRRSPVELVTECDGEEVLLFVVVAALPPLPTDLWRGRDVSLGLSWALPLFFFLGFGWS